jgi:hypothetical protein
MWFVIKANTPYEVDTETGYTAFNGYDGMCVASGRGGKHWIDE